MGDQRLNPDSGAKGGEAPLAGIRPAERLQELSEYYFSRKLREIARRNEQGQDIISLGIGSPDCPPSEAAIAVLCEQARRSDTHGYQPNNGTKELRQAFAGWYDRWYGIRLDPEREILPLMGSKEGVLHVSMAFLNPGDGVLIPNPGYPTYRAVSKLLQARIVEYDLDENRGWWPDFEALEAGDLSGVKLMWVNYPNMPTGAPASRELFEELVAFGRRHGIVIVHDNPYSFILNEHPLSILSVEGARDIAIELNSMSKAHNMPGWRLGMLAANPEFMSWIMKVITNIESGQFRPMQLAAVRALQADKSWYDGMNAVYRRRRELAEAIMTELGCRYDPRQAGMFLWGRIPDDCQSAESLSDRVLDLARVFVTPGFIFGSRGERYLRLSLCCSEEKLSEALKRIREALKRG
ncbi:MAG: aminotransferase class I/II-fold pyridoxal phosphate-dependent enzyme [Bacteroidales bacterium]|nr:aminotransferase class I/II-fold pyridoxal phosphate-dependent enzyme [Bacteroidales bacterium]